MLTILLVLVVLFFYYSKFFFNYYRVWRKSMQFPGPVAWPFIGNLFHFWNQKPSEIFNTILNLVNTYGNAVKIWLGPDLNFVISDPKDMEAFLTSQEYIDKGSNYKYIEPWLSTGLLISSGRKWHQRRKVLTPAFHFKILEQFVEIFERQSEIFVDVLSNYTEQTPVDLYHLVTSYALDVICESAMGTVMNAQRDSNSEYVQAVKDVTHIINSRFFDIFLKFDVLFYPSPYGKRQKKLLEILHNFTENVIEKRRHEIESNNIEASVETDVDEFGTKKKQAFLDVLLKSTIDGKPLTNKDIREEVDTFMFEGHDTTTSGITFTLYNIAKYPEVQEKCYQEVISVLGKENDKQATYSDLCELNYLEKVIKESLRLFPPVPLIQRSLKEDATINGRIFPRNTNVVFHIYSMGRNPKYFKDPLNFRPERFDNDNLKEFDTFAYVPFSAGPRNCIGQKFAMVEMKSVISKVLRNFHLSLIDDKKPILRAELILRPDISIMFRVSKRIKNKS